MATVRVIFNEGESNEYVFPVVQSETGSDLEEDKDLIIEGVRADGSIVIPGGKKSKEIVIKGILIGTTYGAITTLMDTMKTNVDTAVSTLKLQHYTTSWVDDWSYTVKRISEISFPETLRTSSQEYEVTFLVLSY